MKIVMTILFFCLCATGVEGFAMSDDFEKKRYQGFEIGNDGEGAIRDFRITYGELVMPHGSNFAEIPPIHMPMGSESRVVPIPEWSNIRWRSSAGFNHSVDVPVRSLIKDISTFYGWRFYFRDEHIDVYIVRKVTTPKLEGFELVREKVFSK